jgi:lantibiotic biosynthesis protein
MHQIANRRLTEITGAIDAGTIHSDSLLGGQLGLILYYYHLYEVAEENSYREKTLQLLDEVVDNLQAGNSRLVKYTFGSGAAGFGYMMSFLEKRKFIEMDLRQEMEELDQYLFEEAIRQVKTEAVDYLHGAMGVLHYFTTRMNEEHIRQYADQVIVQLDNKAIYDDKGMRLENIFSGNEHPGEYNLGLSHGLSGILLILINAFRYSEHKKLIQNMVGEGVRYILHHRQDVDFANGIYNYFPLVVNEKTGGLSESNRLGWCYGDLNQVLLLNRAGRLLDRENYIKLAQLIGLQTLLRTDANSTLVMDSHFCHGSSGLAQFYRVLHQVTGHEGYRAGYEQWMEQTLLHIEREMATGKYAGRETQFLEGLVGVALTLLSYVSGKELQWSRCLLL